MKLTGVATNFFGWVALVIAAQDRDQDIDHGAKLYREAIEVLGELPSQYSLGEPVVTQDSINNNFFVPQYNEEEGEYEVVGGQSVTLAEDRFHEVVVPKLEEAAAMNNSDALVALGDIYMFGNYSMKLNYSKAFEYYKQSVALEAQGHAYFMLGFLHSTGAFGEIPVDQSKAHLYYEFGAANDDMNSILALAYRYLRGIGTAENCQLGAYYYSKLSRLGTRLQTVLEELFEDNFDQYDISLPDFNGGLFGSKLSEGPSSIISASEIYISNKVKLNELSLDSDHECGNLYYDALLAFHGDLFHKGNRTRSVELLEECISYDTISGDKESNRYMDSSNRKFLAFCYQRLGHMYLKGYGVEKDYKSALKYLNTSLKVQNTSDALNDIGLVYASGALGGEDDIKSAMRYFNDAIYLSSMEARLNLAKLLISLNNGDIFTSPFRKLIYENIRQVLTRDSCHYFGELIESGIANLENPEERTSCETLSHLYQLSIKRFTRFFFPHLVYAFQELKYGHYKNALIGYLIAAEQGLTNAQVSAAYLLYQEQPIYSRRKRKTFSEKRVRAAINFLEKASIEGHVDATILLGNMYLYGIPDSKIAVDLNRAFNLFKIASQKHSSQGSYSLGYMYEYGLDPSNNSIDYFMAKRYYDLSLKTPDGNNFNKIPTQLALLRLRLKYLFNRNKFKKEDKLDDGSNGWMGAFKSIGNKDKVLDNDPNDRSQKRADAKAKAHHEGLEYTNEEQYDVGDYMVLFMMFSFFLIFFVQNIIQRIRRIRNNQENENDNDIDANQPPMNAQARFNLGGANVEFHFFAI